MATFSGIVLGDSVLEGKLKHRFIFGNRLETGFEKSLLERVRIFLEEIARPSRVITATNVVVPIHVLTMSVTMTIQS
jgi:hypothetical protein